MDLHVALTTALHAIRHRKPEAQVSEETRIQPNQRKKLRAGTHRPYAADWAALIRCVHEVDPGEATKMAAAGLPSELFAPLPVSGEPAALHSEILEASRAVGHISETYLTALADGRLDPQDLDDIEAAYAALVRQASEGLAAVEHARALKGVSILPHHTGERKVS